MKLENRLGQFVVRPKSEFLIRSYVDVSGCLCIYYSSCGGYGAILEYCRWISTAWVLSVLLRGYLLGVASVHFTVQVLSVYIQSRFFVCSSEARYMG